MKKYVLIYGQLLKLNVSNLIAYRSNFVNSILSSVAWGVFTIVSVVLLTLRVTSVYGWKREEIILMTGAYTVMIGIFHTIFSRNFERLSNIINLGQLDYILVKPIDAQFLLSFWFTNYTTLIRLPMGLAVIFYSLNVMKVTPNLLTVCWFSFLILIGLILLYSIWYIVATLTIWFTRISNVVDLMYSVSSISRYPREMFKNMNEYIFIFLLPITYITITPVKYLLNKGSMVDVIVLFLLAFSFLFASRAFWKFALRFYTSASS